MEIFLKILSFIFPVRVEMSESKTSKALEICYSNGKKILNSAESNYSFGGLHTVFDKALKHFSLPYSNMDHVLILGYGGGSIVQLLREKAGFKGKITAVEIDPVVAVLARKHYPDLLKEVDLIMDDAAHYLKEDKNYYDLIITDIFIGREVPVYFTVSGFFELVKERLKEGGIFLQNFMFEEKAGEVRTTSRLEEIFGNVKVMYPLAGNCVACAKYSSHV